MLRSGPLAAIINAIQNLSANGFLARTGSGTVAARTITGTTNLVNVTNGDGVAGNPTITVGSNVVQTSGATFTGNITTAALDGYRANNVTNKYIGADTTQAVQAPFSSLWHDIFAFGAGITRTYEVSADGTTFTAGAVNADNNLFQQKDAPIALTINGSTTLAARWTFNSSGFAYANGAWLVLGFGYGGATAANKTITVESSTDGTTWTTRHTSTHSIQSAPVWHYLTSWSGATYLRITVKWNSGGTIPLTTMRMLTARWGEQGRGHELEYPYEWNSERWMRIGFPAPAYGSHPEPSQPLDVNGNITVNGGKILDLADPTLDTDAATKVYVDTADGLAAQKSANLSDLANVATARTNLGLPKITVSSTEPSTPATGDLWVNTA